MVAVGEDVHKNAMVWGRKSKTFPPENGLISILIIREMEKVMTLKFFESNFFSLVAKCSSGFINPEANCNGSIDPRILVKASKKRIVKSATGSFRTKISEKAGK